MDKPRAWIFDIDGTVALWGDGPDTVPNLPVIAIYNLLYLQNAVKPIFLTGRRAEYHAETLEELKRLGILGSPEVYFCRTGWGDVRSLQEEKKEIYLAFIKPNYEVEFILDDVWEVIEVFGEMGIPGAIVEVSRDLSKKNGKSVEGARSAEWRRL